MPGKRFSNPHADAKTSEDDTIVATACSSSFPAGVSADNGTATATTTAAATHGKAIISHLGEMHVLADDLTAEIDKDLVDIGSSTGRRFIVGRVSPQLRDLKCLGPGHDSVLFQIRLVANDDQRDVLVVLDANDLLSQVGKLLQAAHAGDGKDEQKALALLHVQFAHGGKLFGPCRVQAVATSVTWPPPSGLPALTSRGCTAAPATESVWVGGGGGPGCLDGERYSRLRLVVFCKSLLS